MPYYRSSFSSHVWLYFEAHRTVMAYFPQTIALVRHTSAWLLQDLQVDETTSTSILVVQKSTDITTSACQLQVDARTYTRKSNQAPATSTTPPLSINASLLDANAAQLKSIITTMYMHARPTHRWSGLYTNVPALVEMCWPCVLLMPAQTYAHISYEFATLLLYYISKCLQRDHMQSCISRKVC